MTLGQIDCSNIIVNKSGIKWKLRRTTIAGKNALAWMSVDDSTETQESYISGTSTDVSSNTQGAIEVGNLTLIYPYNGTEYKWQLEPYNDSGTYKLLFKRETTTVSTISDPTNFENNSYTLGTYELATFKISGNSENGSDFYLRPYFNNSESTLAFFEDSISDSNVKYHLPLSTISTETVTNSTTSSTTSGTLDDVISLVWQMSGNLFPSEISSATFANTAVTSINSSDNKNYTGSMTIDSNSTEASTSSLVITLLTGETVTKSISFEVILDNTPPSNPVITNSDSTETSSSSLTVSGTCSTDTDTIKVYNTGGTLLHTIDLTIGNTTWSQAVTLSSGTNTYKATALDTAGNESGYSNLLTTTYTPDTTPPADPVISNSDSTQTDSTSLTVSGTCSTDTNSVKLYNTGGTLLHTITNITTTSSSPTSFVYKFEHNQTASNGLEIITELIAYDTSSNVISLSTSDITLHQSLAGSLGDMIDSVNDETGGYVYFDSSPSVGSDLFTITLTQKVTQFTIYYHRPSLAGGLKIYENSVLKTTTNNGGSSSSPSPTSVSYDMGTTIPTTTVTSWSQAVTLSSGANTYKATALDTAGNESGYSNLLTTTYTPDTTPPSNPVITNSDSTVTLSASLTVSGTCSSDTDTIKIYNTSGTLLHTIDLTIGNTTWSQAVTLSSGTNTYKATALDTAGNESGYSNLLTTTYTPDTTPPADPVISNSDSTVFSSSLTITGTCSSDTNSVKLYNTGGTLLHTITSITPGGITLTQTGSQAVSGQPSAFVGVSIATNATRYVLINTPSSNSSFTAFPSLATILGVNGAPHYHMIHAPSANTFQISANQHAVGNFVLSSGYSWNSATTSTTSTTVSGFANINTPVKIDYTGTINYIGIKLVIDTSLSGNSQLKATVFKLDSLTDSYSSSNDICSYEYHYASVTASGGSLSNLKFAIHTHPDLTSGVTSLLLNTGTLGSPSWSQAVTLSTGANTFKATALDTAGNESGFSSLLTTTLSAAEEEFPQGISSVTTNRQDTNVSWTTNGDTYAIYASSSHSSVGYIQEAFKPVSDDSHWTNVWVPNVATYPWIALKLPVAVKFSKFQYYKRTYYGTAYYFVNNFTLYGSNNSTNGSDGSWTSIYTTSSYNWTETAVTDTTNSYTWFKFKSNIDTSPTSQYHISIGQLKIFGYRT